jgi:FtsH-binding integral membrane protein
MRRAETSQPGPARCSGPCSPLIAFGILAIFVAIPAGNVIYAVAGIVIFGAFTIFDFNRLRRADAESAIVLAASIFLDIFNVFLLLLDLFGGRD